MLPISDEGVNKKAHTQTVLGCGQSERLLLFENIEKRHLKVYKCYPVESHLRVIDECSAHLKNLLQTRYTELEEMRDAINDGYRYEDLFLKWDEVDSEEALIRLLLEHLKTDTEKLKAEKNKQMRRDL